MNKSGRIKIAGYLLVILLVFSNFSNEKVPFEGKLKVVKVTPYDTASYQLYVKDKNLRIDTYCSEGLLAEQMIINLNDKKVILIEPATKKFTSIDNRFDYLGRNENYQVTKSDNYRYFNDHKCFQWRVRNKLLNTEVTYWVAETDNFDFFTDFIQIIQQSENIFDFFLFIPGNEGYFPMMTEERTLVRKIKSQYMVKGITSERIESDLFKIPGNYHNVNYPVR